MSEWSLKRLGDIADMLVGPPFKSAVFRNASSGPRLLRGINLGPDGTRWQEGETFRWPEDLRNEFTRYELAQNDVCIAMDATFTKAGEIRAGMMEIVDLPALLVQRVARLRANLSVVHPYFLLLVVESSAFRDHLTNRQTGAFAPHVSGKDLAAYHFALPPLSEQRRIVDLLRAIDSQIKATVEESAKASAAYVAGSNLLWLYDGSEASSCRLGDVMELDINRVPLDPSATYSSAGVLGSGLGLVDRGPFRGDETEYSTMNVLRTNQVVMRKLTAWEGPITVISPEFNGYVASSEFPTFTLSDSVSPEWMRHVCRTERLWKEMKSRVTGTVQRRKRLNPDQLLSVTLPVPPRKSQEQAAAALESLDTEVRSLRREISNLRAFRSALLTSLLNQEIEIHESYDALLKGVS